jgi:hypothetical protein
MRPRIGVLDLRVAVVLDGRPDSLGTMAVLGSPKRLSTSFARYGLSELLEDCHSRGIRRRRFCQAPNKRRHGSANTAALGELGSQPLAVAVVVIVRPIQN